MKQYDKIRTILAISFCLSSKKNKKVNVNAMPSLFPLIFSDGTIRHCWSHVIWTKKKSFLQNHISIIFRFSFHCTIIFLSAYYTIIFYLVKGPGSVSPAWSSHFGRWETTHVHLSTICGQSDQSLAINKIILRLTEWRLLSLWPWCHFMPFLFGWESR